MNGITILEEHFCRGIELNALIANFLLVGLLATVGIAFYVYVIKTTYDKTTRCTALLCLTMLVVILINFSVFEIKDYHTTRMEYTITIDDSVGFNEFYNKYKIVSVDGEKYRVVEK